MSGQLLAIAGAILGLAAAGFAGYTLGRRYRLACARRRFWIASGISVALGVGVTFIGVLTSVAFVSGAGVGLLTGGLNGLRWGMGRLSDAPRTPEAEAQRPACELPPEDRQHAHPAT